MNALARNFAITFNAPTRDELLWVYDEVKSLLDDTLHCVNQWIFNFETGETGNEHLQMHIDCAEAIRPTALVNAFPCIRGAHFEPVRVLTDSRSYCRKKQGEKKGDVWDHEEWVKPGYVERGERGPAAPRSANAAGLLAERCVDMASTGNSWANIARIFGHEQPLVFMRCAKQLKELHTATYEPKKMEDVVLKPWQAMIKARTEGEADGRTITWVYDVEGNKGKSFLCEYLIRNHGAIMVDGRIADMAFGYNGQKVVCIDIARGQSENMQHLHVFAEKVASGCIYNSKYESGMKLYDVKPHVIVFANVRHNAEWWTAGRAHEINLPDWIAQNEAGVVVEVAAAQLQATRAWAQLFT